MTTPEHAVSATEIIFPEHANHYGTLFAGNALLMMTKTAFLAARTFANADVVVARVGDVKFLAPVPVGSLLRLNGRVTRVGRSSLTVSVEGTAEQLGVAEKPVLQGLFEMVVVDGNGRPLPIRTAGAKTAGAEAADMNSIKETP